MSFKLHLILGFFMHLRCNFPDISYLSETQKNTYQFFNKNQYINLHVSFIPNFCIILLCIAHKGAGWRSG